MFPLFFLPLALASTTDTSCLPLSTWADRARDDLVAGEFDKVRDDLDRAEATLDCRVATSSDIARFRLYEGALLSLTGDTAGATRAFAAARRLDPEGWDPVLGSSLEAAWLAANPGAEVSVTVDTNQDRTLLDGTALKKWPATIPSGALVVQVLGHDKGEVHGHVLLDVPAADLPVTLATGLTELPPKDRSAQHRKAAPWLLASVASLAGSGGLALYTLNQRDASGTAPTIEEATLHHDRQMVGAWSTLGLAGAGALLFTAGAVTW